jgi:outer membrane protein TolC
MLDLRCYPSVLAWNRFFSVVLISVSATLLASQVPLPGQPSGGAQLGLDDCIRLAMEAPSTVRAARQELRATNYAVNVAVGSFFPMTSAQGGYTYNSPSHGAQSFIALNATREYQTFLNTTVELDTSGRLRGGLARAKADRDVARANVQIEERDLKRAVTAAYYRVLLAKHIRDTAQSSLDEAKRFEDLTRQLLAGGESARADVVKAHAQSAISAQFLEQAELEHRVASQDLASYWTTDVGTELRLVDVLAGPPPEQPGETVVRSTTVSTPYLARPEFARLEANRRGFQADFRIARAGLLPTLAFTYQYGIDAPVYSWSYRGHAAFITLSVPIFDFFQTKNSYKQFQMRAQIVETERQINERQFSRDYQTALARLRSAVYQLKITRDQVKSSEDNLSLAQIRYKGGEGLALDVVTAVQQLAQTRTNYYTAFAEYFNAEADLRVAEGR